LFELHTFCVVLYLHVLFCHLCAVCCIVLASHNSSRAACLHFVPLNRSRVKLLDKGGELKSVILTLDCLVNGECVFSDAIVLFDFRFGESVGLEKILFFIEGLVIPLVF
jgi:hypothetical protein